jgi:hypothetical protein
MLAAIFLAEAATARAVRGFAMRTAVEDAMNDECPWYVVFAMAFILPPSFFGTVWLLGWLTNSDPLITEIWRLRGQNAVLRERLEQLEGERQRDCDTLRKVIGK